MAAQLDKSYLKARFWKIWPRLIAYLLFEGRPITTRGRWLNRLVFGFFKLIQKLPLLKQVKSPIFIVGIGRSGTTALGKLLSMHRDIGYLNEPKALWHSFYSDDDLVGNYQQSGGMYRWQKDHFTASDIQNIHKLYGAYLGLSFSNRIADKYPEHIFRIEEIKNIFPDAKFLFLSRNGHDTSLSIEHWSERLGTEVESQAHNWWGINGGKWQKIVQQLVPEQSDLLSLQNDMLHWTEHTHMAAVEWVLSMREGLKLLDEYPDDILHIKYETLCNEPELELKKILVFMQLDEKDVTFIEYGKKILKRSSSGMKVKLPPVLKSAFEKTQRDLGYDN